MLMVLRVTATALNHADLAAMGAAAAEACEARAVAFLLGSHPRVGAASPVRVLPSALLLAILDAALKAGARTHFSVTPPWTPPQAQLDDTLVAGEIDGGGGEGAVGAAGAAAGPSAPTSVGGLDLEFAATFV